MALCARRTTVFGHRPFLASAFALELAENALRLDEDRKVEGRPDLVAGEFSAAKPSIGSSEKSPDMVAAPGRRTAFPGRLEIGSLTMLGKTVANHVHQGDRYA